MARIIQLILTYDRRGSGREDDPVRMVPQLFSLDGKLVAEIEEDKGQKRKTIFNPENIEADH